MTVTFDASTLARRPEFEQIAVEAGWERDSHTESTDFVRDGWRIAVRWMEGDGFPASFAAYDPAGQTARSMNYLADEWAVGGELLMQLKAPGPLRDSRLPLDVLTAAYLTVLEMTEKTQPGYRLPVHAVAERLRDFLEEAAS